MARALGRKAWPVAAVAAVAVIVGAGTALLRLKRAQAPSAQAPAVPTVRKVVAFEARETIYDLGLKPGWTEAGVGQKLEPGAPAAVVFGGFGGWVLRHAPLSGEFGALVFRIKVPPGFGEFLQVSLRHGEPDEVTFPKLRVSAADIAPLADGWSEVLLPFRSLNPSALPFDRVALEAHRMVGNEAVSVDKLLLTKPDAEQRTDPAVVLRPARVKVDCAAPARAISPLIYGIARGVYASGESAHRIGGNAMTRLNWDLGNVWNTGNDWFFENVRGPDQGLSQWLGEAQSRGVAMALTVPTIGWVAKDDSSVGFPISKLGPQRKFDEQRPNAGDGYGKDGKRLTPGPPTQTSEEASPERIEGWVKKLAEEDARSGKRRVQMYLLDNEPDLWHETHRDIHPEPLSYDELLDRSVRYGSAIRRADPQAVIAGPASWGWTGYFFSAKDMAAGALLQPDRRAHGGVPLIPWYLSKLAEHQRTSGVRVLDVLDVHYYPQAEGVYGGRADVEAAALRLRSTRSLWDPSYKDESWINDQVQLIPRLQDWIAKNYPGLGLSLGEWSFGAEQHISGALATAEALGRFGQLGLTAAFYWAEPAAGTPTFWAFRAFRNYDGKGARFLDFAVKSEPTQGLSVFVSRDEASSRFVVIALGLEPGAGSQLELDTSSCGELEVVRSFSYAGGAHGIALDPAAPAGRKPGLSVPPYSLKIIELSPVKK
jgi:hypothetical protein